MYVVFCIALTSVDNHLSQIIIHTPSHPLSCVVKRNARETINKGIFVSMYKHCVQGMQFSKYCIVNKCALVLLLTEWHDLSTACICGIHITLIFLKFEDFLSCHWVTASPFHITQIDIIFMN